MGSVQHTGEGNSVTHTTHTHTCVHNNAVRCDVLMDEKKNKTSLLMRILYIYYDRK